MKRTHRFYINEDGASAVEFALITPVLLVLLLGLLDYAMIAFHKMELESATRSGAQYATLNATDTTVISTAVQNATNLDTSKLNVSVLEYCECDNDGSVVSCGGNCGTNSMRKYMDISASYSHTPFFLPGTMTLSRDSTVRTQ